MLLWLLTWREEGVCHGIGEERSGLRGGGGGGVRLWFHQFYGTFRAAAPHHRGWGSGGGGAALEFLAANPDSSSGVEWFFAEMF